MIRLYAFVLFLFAFIGSLGLLASGNSNSNGIPLKAASKCSGFSSDNGHSMRPCSKLCDNDKCELRLAVILPNDSSLAASSLPEVMPFLKKAVQYAHDNDILEKWVTVNLIPKDDMCHASYAQKALIEYYSNSDYCIHAIFGPVCDYCVAGVSRIVKFFQTPLLTAGGFSNDFDKPKRSCDDEYFMLVRTGTLVFQGLSQFFRQITNRFQWKKVAFLYDKQGQRELAGQNTCSLMMQTLVQELSEVKGFQYKDGDLGLSTFNVSEFLRKDIGVNYGIIVMCASHDRIREILLAAADLDQMVYQGEYLFFNIELINEITNRSHPWEDEKDEYNRTKLKDAYKSVLTLTSAAEDSGLNIQTKSNNSAGFYDAMLLYLNTVGNYIRRYKNNTILDGYKLVYDMYNITFQGLNGEVQMNENGDRITYYSLLTFNSDNNSIQVAADYRQGDTEIKFNTKSRIYWPGDSDLPPLDTPVCGFDNSKCQTSFVPIVSFSVLIVLVIILIFVCVFIYRHYKEEKEIAAMSWKVHWTEVSEFSDILNPQMDYVKFGSKMTVFSELSNNMQVYMPIGYYKSMKVALKKITLPKLELSQMHLKRLKLMQDLQHDHLVRFYGACFEPPHQFLLMEYCQKGSLQDVLEKDDIKLELMIRKSFIHDLVRGMSYLHNSDIRSHGSLSSSNCVVDGRLVLKIADFGLRFLNKSEEEPESYAYWRKKLWVAPELLRMPNPPDDGTQKGDVYSCGIIMHEIMLRKGPFYLGYDLPPKDIAESVKNGIPSSSGQPLRPLIDDASTEDEVAALMRRCWAEDAADRPDFPALKNTIRKLNKEHDSGNILDNLLSRMEQYANNLETLVEERTADYLEEKRKCEELLYQLLPKSVASQLIMGQSVIAETYDQVTIYFSDIVDFTSLSARSTPLQVVEFLNDLYTCFDSIVEHFDVYKVETIGDSYMVVSGLPVRNGNLHAREIARMSLALLANVRTFTIRHLPYEKLKIRIGMHTGPCVAGVVGLKMPRYCLFGDTVNTASRMESNGAPLRIQVSLCTKEVLDQFGTFELEYRGVVEVKGKGKMVTYWLNGEKSSSNSTNAVAASTSKKVSSQAVSSPALSLASASASASVSQSPSHSPSPSTNAAISTVNSNSLTSLRSNSSSQAVTVTTQTSPQKPALLNSNSSVNANPNASASTSTSTNANAAVCFKNRAYTQAQLQDDAGNMGATVPLLSVTAVTGVDKD